MSGIIDTMVEADKELMVVVNMPQMHGAFMDTLMWSCSQTALWLPMFAVLLLMLWKTKKKQGLLMALCMIMTIVVCDQLSSGLLKPLVERLRPSNDPSICEQLKLVANYHGSRFGFPSSHAANTFGLATIAAMLLRERATTVTMYLWAALCSYTRLYLGVHYPGDIAVGLLIGLASGLGMSLLCRKLLERPYWKTEDGNGDGNGTNPDAGTRDCRDQTKAYGLALAAAFAIVVLSAANVASHAGRLMAG